MLFVHNLFSFINISFYDISLENKFYKSCERFCDRGDHGHLNLFRGLIEGVTT